MLTNASLIVVACSYPCPRYSNPCDHIFMQVGTRFALLRLFHDSELMLGLIVAPVCRF